MSSNRLSESLSFRVSDPKDAVKIFGPASLKLKTIPECFKEIVKIFPDRKALVVQNEVSKLWQSLTYVEYQSQVEKIAKAFIKLGLRRHGVVAVFAHNSVEWILSEVAAIHSGFVRSFFFFLRTLNNLIKNSTHSSGIITGIYTTNSAEATFHVLESSRANICVVDDDAKLQMVLGCKDRLPNLKAVVYTHETNIESLEGCFSWRILFSMESNDVEFEFGDRQRKIAANECCAIFYTSGTVGDPKGAMLSHDNLVFVAEESFESLGNIVKGEEVFISYLPLSHLAAQIADVFCAILCGGTVYIADKDALKSSLLNTLVEAEPTFFLGVPRVYEKIQEKLMEAGAQAGLTKRLVANWAKSVALKYHMDRMSGNISGSLQFRIASKLILSRVKQALGFQNCKYFITGAAPLKESTRDYFLSLDIQLFDGYGMTESAGVHALANTHNLRYSRSVKGTETKIINFNDEGHGEICIRGRNVFMGYINEPEKTAEAIDDDRWFHTGDLGFIDGDGLIHITGRLKELLITSGGENIPYVSIENAIKAASPAISNAFLVGDNQRFQQHAIVFFSGLITEFLFFRFLSILLTLKTKLSDDGTSTDFLEHEALNWLKSFGVQNSKLSLVVDEKALLNAIQSVIDRVNSKSTSRAQKIHKFVILLQDFSIPTGELTPTMKVKRNFVLSKYQDLIDSFYA